MKYECKYIVTARGSILVEAEDSKSFAYKAREEMDKIFNEKPEEVTYEIEKIKPVSGSNPRPTTDLEKIAKNILGFEEEKK